MEFAQQDITPTPETRPEKPILPVPPAKGTEPAEEETPKIQPLPATVENPEVVPPKVEPSSPKTEPTKPELTAEEIKNRKLISDDPQENLEVLNQALDAWLATHEEMPEKIADLVMGDHLPMLPMAPVGQRFEIDPITKRIVLVANN